MSFIVKDSKSDFTPAPEGLHQFVCVDMIPGIKRQSKWGEQDKVRLVFQTKEKNPETGKPYIVTEEYTPSLHKKSNLRGDLESWRGRKFTDEELEGFDLEKVVGVNGQMQVIHNVTPDGKVFGNASAYLPIAKDTARIQAVDYVRVKDRKPEEQGAKEPEVKDEF